jgi:hypothetical protein
MNKGALLPRLVLCSLIGLSGCSSKPASHPAGAPIRLVDSQGAEAFLTTDFTTLRDEWYLFRAQQSLVARCMRAQGLRYIVTSPGPEPSTGTVTADALGPGEPLTYGVAGDLSGEAGRSDSLSASARSSIPPEDRYTRHLPPAEQAAYEQTLLGQSQALAPLRLPSGMEVRYRTGGCVAQARTTLFGSVDAALRDSLVPQDVRRSFEDVLSTDPQYSSALLAWRHCMVRAGWNYANPQFAIESVREMSEQGLTPRAQANRDTSVATADSICDARSGLRKTRLMALRVYLNQQPHGLVEQLSTIQELRGRAVGIAINVLAG